MGNAAIGEGPWNFFKNLIVFKEPSGWRNPRTMVFNEMSIWVQDHNIPLACMHEELLRKLGKLTGTLLEMDKGDNGVVMGNYARLRVFIDITKPLKKFIRIKAIEEAEDIIIILVYERLPNFCYACGRVGHSFSDYDDAAVDKSKQSFGPWLRAASHVGWDRKIHTNGTKTGQTKGDKASHATAENTNRDLHLLLLDNRNPSNVTRNTQQIKDGGSLEHKENYILGVRSPNDTTLSSPTRATAQLSENTLQKEITPAVGIISGGSPPRSKNENIPRTCAISRRKEPLYLILE